MDRRNFLKSVAAFAVAAKFRPARKPIPDWRSDFDIVKSKPSPEQAAMMDRRYYMGIDTAFGQDKTVIAYYIADSSASGPVPMYIWKNDPQKTS